MKIRGFVFLVGLLATLPAHAGVIAQLEAPDLNDLRMTGFELDQEADVTIDAVGIRADGEGTSFLMRLFSRADNDTRQMSVYAWLLDAESRKPVWTMKAGNTKTISDKLASEAATVHLSPGRYELYLASSNGRYQTTPPDEENGTLSFWDLFGGDRGVREDLLKDLPKCHVTLRVDGMSTDRLRVFEPTGLLGDALLSVNRLGDSRLETRGIEVRAPTTIGLYSIFEQPTGSDQPADFAWMIDEVSRELIWSADRKRSQPAGGSTKNRLLEDNLSLKPGRYLIYVGTDISHSFDAFNAAPPYDPLNWGLTLRAGAGFSEGSIEMFEPVVDDTALIDFSKAGDDAQLQQGFRMIRGGQIHVRAFGEYSSGEFFDRAWITDSTSGATEWEMTGPSTTAAGGSRKNRMFDGLVELPEGEYVLHYTSDGSHAFGDWNSAAPFEPEGWGVVLRRSSSTDAGEVELIGGENR